VPGSGATRAERCEEVPETAPPKKTRILLGVTGGIAAYKSADVVRALVKRDFEVDVVMTAHAREFITPLTLQTLSQRPVWTGLFETAHEYRIGHIELVDRADLVLVAPATANILAKAAHGICDDLLSTILCVASRLPVMFAPAMNVNMFHNPVTQENIRALKARGCYFVEPGEGELACGHHGVGRLADPEDIAEQVVFRVTPKDLEGERVLVTAGRTEEDIDPVRFITNASSGKMGFAVARAAAQRGAEVILVSGPTHCKAPVGVRLLPVRSAQQMRDAVMDVYEGTTVVVMAAAVSDFRPRSRVSQKIKKEAGLSSLALERTPDILAEVGGMKGERVLVGFAAETERVVENAREKLARKHLDIIVANDNTQEGVGFQSDFNKVSLISKDGTVEDLPRLPKDTVAHRILDRVRAIKHPQSPASP